MAVSGILEVRVVSPQAVVFEGEATGVVIPAWDGQVGILPGHAPLITLLGEGALAIDFPSGGSEELYVRGGVARVEGDRVTILSEAASLVLPEGAEGRSVWLDVETFERESEELEPRRVGAQPDLSTPGDPLA